MKRGWNAILNWLIVAAFGILLCTFPDHVVVGVLAIAGGAFVAVWGIRTR
jgi:hypothetical protein